MERQTQQVEKLTQIIRGSNQFSQSRAIYNVEKLGEELKLWRERSGKSSLNEQMRSNIRSNEIVFEAAEEEIRELAEQERIVPDNRKLLNTFYDQQENKLSKNSVTRLGVNFVDTHFHCFHQNPPGIGAYTVSMNSYRYSLSMGLFHHGRKKGLDDFRCQQPASIFKKNPVGLELQNLLGYIDKVFVIGSGRRVITDGRIGFYPQFF